MMMAIPYLIYQSLRLRRNQWLGPSELRLIQQRKLRKVIRHAYEHVPYYRRLFDSAGIRSDAIRGPEDLCKIPITSRRELQALPVGDITQRGLDLHRCMKVKTTGTTGTPLDILIGPHEVRYRGVVLRRIFSSYGCRLTGKWVRVTNALIPAPRHWYQSLGIRRVKLVNILRPMEDQIRIIREEKPDVLEGFASGIRAIAETVKREKIRGICPKIVITGAEMLTEESREIIEEVLGVKVFDLYNSWEFGSIAWECQEHAGYHVNADGLIVEVIRDGREAVPGESGKIVITSLSAFAMPFIRYALGDIATMSDRRCPCGRGLPLLERIEGRADDVIKIPGGKTVAPYLITQVLRYIPGIHRFRFVQERDGHCRVEIVEGTGFSPDTVEEIKKSLRKILGQDLHLDVQTVDEIPHDPSGKLRVVLSRT